MLKPWQQNTIIAVLLIGVLLQGWRLASFPYPTPYHDVESSGASESLPESRQDIAAEATAYYTKLLAGFTGCLFVSTTGLWVFTGFLWKTTKRAVESSDKQHAISNRAFVFLDGFNVELTTAVNAGTININSLPEPYKSRPELYITRFAVQPRWKNGGNTPTKDMRFQVDWRGPPFPDGVYGPDEAYRSVPDKLFIAPQGVEPTRLIEIPSISEIVDWAFSDPSVGEQPPFLIWGRADYEDTFGETHYIEWCYLIRLDDHKGDGLRATFTQWGERNSAD
jgi:hypothetical protein